MRLRNAASMLRVRTRQPDTARTAFTDQIILLDTNEHRCNTASLQSPVENLSLRGALFDSALYPSVATSYRIVEHHYTAIYAPFPSATHHRLTSIPDSTGRTPPRLSLQGGWSLRLRRNACRPVILTQCVQLWDYSWYTCERLRIATFTRACFSHTFRQTSVDATQPFCRAVWRNLTATVFLLSLLVPSGFVGFIHD